MSIYEGLKDAAGILKEAGKIPEYQQILEAQAKLLEMQKTIKELESENQDLKDALKTKGNLQPEENYYWLIEDGKKDGPYCTKCWDADKKLLRLHQNPTFGSLVCPSCGTYAKRSQARILR